MSQNGQLKQLAQDLINDDKATQHQKLNGILRYSMYLDRRIDEISEDVKENPLSWIPKEWRKRVATVFGAWMLVVTIAFAERLPDIIAMIKDWGLF